LTVDTACVLPTSVKYMGYISSMLSFLIAVRSEVSLRGRFLRNIVGRAGVARVADFAPSYSGTRATQASLT